MDEKKILPKCHALAVKKTRTKVVTIDHPETKKKTYIVNNMSILFEIQGVND